MICLQFNAQELLASALGVVSLVSYVLFLSVYIIIRNQSVQINSIGNRAVGRLADGNEWKPDQGASRGDEAIKAAARYIAARTGRSAPGDTACLQDNIIRRMPGKGQGK